MNRAFWLIVALLSVPAWAGAVEVLVAEEPVIALDLREYAPDQTELHFSEIADWTLSIAPPDAWPPQEITISGLGTFRLSMDQQRYERDREENTIDCWQTLADGRLGMPSRGY